LRQLAATLSGIVVATLCIVAAVGLLIPESIRDTAT